MKLNFTKICIILASLTIGNASSDTDLWCYECNRDLSLGHKAECNDPYSPAPSSDLVACPRNDSQVCLKSVIFYNNIHVTVRSCAPSSQKTTYCSFENAVPDASIECLFCNDYACNASHRIATSTTNRYLVVSSIVILIAVFEILRST